MCDLNFRKKSAFNLNRLKEFYLSKYCNYHALICFSHIYYNSVMLWYAFICISTAKSWEEY